MSHLFSIARSAVKGVVDSCILPGTAMGAEIVWLYAMEWKNQCSLYCFAVMSLILSHTLDVRVLSSGRDISEQENTM